MNTSRYHSPSHVLCPIRLPRPRRSPRFRPRPLRHTDGTSKAPHSVTFTLNPRSADTDAKFPGKNHPCVSAPFPKSKNPPRLGFVVDASVAFASCFQNESTPFTDALLSLWVRDSSQRRLPRQIRAVTFLFERTTSGEDGATPHSDSASRASHTRNPGIGPNNTGPIASTAGYSMCPSQ